MNLLELQEKDPRAMTKEELEQSCLKLLEELHEIVDTANTRIKKDKDATTDRI